MGRDIRVAFKMNEEKKEELQAYADSYGVTMSALCALIVGQWLHNQNQVINPIVESMGQVLREQLKNLDDNESVADLIRKARENKEV
jgi:antitoxin component of RelBE/YafQ-DinJ toxin-antitoxin module